RTTDATQVETALQNQTGSMNIKILILQRVRVGTQSADVESYRNQLMFLSSGPVVRRGQRSVPSWADASSISTADLRSGCLVTLFRIKVDILTSD
ncbi:hypothetical protein GOODEAATRI_010871, partial [Goodea atripinnis]